MILGEEFTEPVGAPSSVPQYRLMNVFTKCTEDLIKMSVLQESTDHDSCLRVVICTAAFGMGIDCVGFNRVVHFGPPDDVETYIQQSGRAGRDGLPAHCLLFIGKDQCRFCDKTMKNYCGNTTICRKDCLFLEFSSYTSTGYKCNCCDVCAERCKCSTCLQLLEAIQCI